MNHILIVSGNEQSQAQLQQMLHELQLSAEAVADSGLDARRMLEKQVFDLVIINAPLPDEHGEAVARLAYNLHSEVVLLIRPEHADAVRERVGKTGIHLISKPLKKAIFLQDVQCILVQQSAIEQLQEERDRLYRQIQDTKLLNRAKLVLMQVLKLSEPQAHHYIERQAMDLRITKREVAEGIISTYET